MNLRIASSLSVFLAVLMTTTARAEVKVVVDPRIELMGILQELGGYFLSSQVISPYRQDVLVSFCASAKDPAVLLLSTMSQGSFNADVVPRAFLSLSPPPDLEPLGQIPKDVVTRAGGQVAFDQMVVTTREFAIRNNFNAFFAANAATYSKIIEATHPEVEALAKEIEVYLGTPLGDAAVVLSPLLHNGGFGVNAERIVPGAPVYAVIGPSAVKNDLPVFGPPEHLHALVVHELLHTVINPITERHRTEIDRYKNLYAPVATSMQPQGYSDWQITFTETLIRAIGIRLSEKRIGLAAAQAASKKEIERGFRELPRVVSALATYENQRASYPRLEDYLPRLLKSLAAASARNDLNVHMH